MSSKVFRLVQQFKSLKVSKQPENRVHEKDTAGSTDQKDTDKGLQLPPQLVDNPRLAVANILKFAKARNSIAKTDASAAETCVQSSPSSSASTIPDFAFKLNLVQFPCLVLGW